VVKSAYLLDCLGSSAPIHVHAWHSDPDYQKIIPIRTQAYHDLEITVFQE